MRVTTVAIETGILLKPVRVEHAMEELKSELEQFNVKVPSVEIVR